MRIEPSRQHEQLRSLEYADMIQMGEIAMIPESGSPINIAAVVTYRDGTRELFDLAQLPDTGQTFYQWASDNYVALSAAIETGSVLTVEISGDGQWRYSNLATLTNDGLGNFTSTYPVSLVAGAIWAPLVEAEEIVRFP